MHTSFPVIFFHPRSVQQRTIDFLTQQKFLLQMIPFYLATSNADLSFPFAEKDVLFCGGHDNFCALHLLQLRRVRDQLSQKSREDDWSGKRRNFFAPSLSLFLTFSLFSERHRRPRTRNLWPENFKGSLNLRCKVKQFLWLECALYIWRIYNYRFGNCEMGLTSSET